MVLILELLTLLETEEVVKTHSNGRYKVYKRLRTQCHTVNQVNQLHIKYENRSTPAELIDIQRPLRFLVPSLQKLIGAVAGLFRFSLGARYDELQVHLLREISSVRWSRKTKRLLRTGGRRNFREWQVSLRTRTQIRYLSTPQDNSGERVLLYAVCGITDRIGMPISLFLSQLDTPNLTVIQLNKGFSLKFRDYLSSTNRQAWLDDIETFRSLASGYDRVLILGQSLGGLTAIALAAELESAHCLAMGAGIPNDQFLSHIRERLAKDRRNVPTIVLGYGEEAKKDKLATEIIASHISISAQIQVPSSPHSFLHVLTQRKQVKPFLDSYLFDFRM